MQLILRTQSMRAALKITQASLFLQINKSFTERIAL